MLKLHQDKVVFHHEVLQIDLKTMPVVHITKLISKTSISCKKCNPKTIRKTNWPSSKLYIEFNAIQANPFEPGS